MTGSSNRGKKKMPILPDTDEDPMPNIDYEVELSDDDQLKKVLMPPPVLGRFDLLQP